MTAFRMVRATRLRHAALIRAVVLVALVIGAIGSFAGPAAASGPTSLGVSGWQVYSNPNVYSNPLYIGPFGFYLHGDPGEYAGAPGIPAQTDPGWANCGPSAPLRSSPYASTRSLCPNPSTIGMSVGSILTTPCFGGLNFTYFQALVSIPAGTTVSQFSVDMSGADDGARISLVNSAYPGGVVPPGGYIYQLTGQSTGNLAPYVVAGEVNRVVITQVDDCAVGNNLNSAQISLNGTVIPPDTTPPVANPVASPAANGNGWNNSDVTVNWNWSDAGSGIDTANCPQTSSSSGEGVQTLSSTCYDNAGNHASRSLTVRVDKTAPTLSVPAPISVETASPLGTTVSYSATATDNLDPSPAVSCSPASGSSFPLGQTTVSCTATDQAGNSSTKTFTVAVSLPVPASGQAQGVASHVSTVQEQVATSSTTDTGSPDFTGQPWFTPVAARGGQGHPAYGRFPGTDWLSEYVNSDGNATNPHWSRYRASFDAPYGGMTLKVMADNAVTGIWVNGIPIGPCSRASVCDGFSLPGTTVSIPDADLQPTGNVVQIEVLDYELGLATGAVDFEVIPQPPTVAPVVAGTLGSNGWYTSNVSVHWNVVGADSTSAGCADTSVSTDTSGVTFTCTATNTGGSTTKSVTVKRDATGPSLTASATAGGNPYTAGTWTNQDVTVHFSCTDATSGVASVSGDQTVSSEGDGQSVGGSCTDNAGNTATTSFDQIRIDKTAPTVSTAVFDGNGNPVDVSQWSNQNLTVTFPCSDSASGVSSVTDPQTVSSDGITHVVGTCVDAAGNSASASVDVKVDETAPTIVATATAGGNPYTAGTWTNQDVTVHFSCTDATSGVASVSGDQTVSSEGDGQSVGGSCTDNAGNTATTSFDQIRIDKTAPSLAPSVSPNPVGLGFAAVASPGASDSGSGIASASCASVDTSTLGAHTVACTATDNAGNTATASASYDVTGTATKQAVLSEIQATAATASKHDADKLNEAAKKLADALKASFWTDPNHPASKKVFEDEKEAVQKLSELLKDEHSAVPAAKLQSWIGSLVTLDRALASLALSEATGGDQHQLAEAAKELANGDREAAKGHLNDAIEHYGNAWQKVQESLKH